MNLVTGATGLLGSHIVEQLRRRDRPVRVLVRSGADVRWLQTQGVEMVRGDLNDLPAVRRACEGVQCIYHAAARVGDWGPWEDFLKVTVDGTHNVFDAAEQCGVPRFIHISSISVYGHRNEPGLVIDETAPLGVKVHRWSYYTRAKVMVEKELNARQAAGSKVKFTVIRPSWLYGPRDRATIARLVAMVRDGKAKLLGDGNNRLNVVHAANVAEACILAADNPQAVGQAYNCSNDGELTQRQYFNMVANAIGAKPVTRCVPFKVAYQAAFTLECVGHLFKLKKPPMITRYAVWLMGRHTFFSADKARRELGWKSAISYEEGIPAAIRWFEEHQRHSAAARPAMASA
ncbi:MAG TPA: NAD-dependent epimerase/dehydratase family protein [Phycisphaerae bacterium]|nr:NAD-dependent epimerase/dehydratase family protein [Phycisphaerae bacterium]